MKADLVRIGNSQGIRIPKALLEECGFKDAVDIKSENGRLVITPAHGPRKNWNTAFEEAAIVDGEDELLMGDIQNDWDQEEWTW